MMHESNVGEHEAVSLGHGSGGGLTNQMIEEFLLPGLDNPYLEELHDGAVIPWQSERLAFSTDSFVVNPLFFPGGNIGLLAVHGTTNDLSMCGARPRFLSLSLILEEGLPFTDLRTILNSIRSACDELSVQVVTGDTKVIERGSGDGVYINTSGIGEVLPGVSLSPKQVRQGDKILVSGPIAEHGMAVMAERSGLDFGDLLKSDTAALWPVVEPILKVMGDQVHVMRDATRGGVSSVLNEIAKSAGVGIVIEESQIPIKDPVVGACEILGLDPLQVANEGRFVCFVDREFGEQTLSIMQKHPLGHESRIIGEVVADHPGVVRMLGDRGKSRVVEMLSYSQLPRIC